MKLSPGQIIMANDGGGPRAVRVVLPYNHSAMVDAGNGYFWIPKHAQITLDVTPEAEAALLERLRRDAVR